MTDITAKDREEEARVADALTASLGYPVRRFGDVDALDLWGGEDWDRVRMVAEVKTRYIESTKHKDVYLEMKKYHYLRVSSEINGVKAYFVANFTDRMMIIDVHDLVPALLKTVVSGRWDRGRVNDVDPMVLVPIADMTDVRLFRERP